MERFSNIKICLNFHKKRHIFQNKIYCRVIIFFRFQPRHAFFFNSALFYRSGHTTRQSLYPPSGKYPGKNKQGASSCFLRTAAAASTSRLRNARRRYRMRHFSGDMREPMYAASSDCADRVNGLSGIRARQISLGLRAEAGTDKNNRDFIRRILLFIGIVFVFRCKVRFIFQSLSFISEKNTAPKKSPRYKKRLARPANRRLSPPHGSRPCGRRGTELILNRTASGFY